ncbi:MAG: endonuclease III [Chloroflexota bacterium]|nr:MAG: endonuclease III [Chloroflexota bacterium]
MSVTKVSAGEVVDRLDPEYAGLTCGLQFHSPLQLLVATILSAQCTDERVNMVTPTLFARYPDVEALANAERTELEEIIHSCGFFRNKAKSIQLAAQVILDRFEGQVPETMEELVTLPGVARKTGNVVLAHAFGRNEGIAVDTHVQRLARRLALTDQKDPDKIERDLMASVRYERWGRLSDVLIWHGRRVCSARSPRCEACVLNDVCPSSTVPAGMAV